MRVFVQLDVQNLFFSAKDIQKKIDFLKIRDHFFNSGDDIVALVAYLVRSPEANRSEKFELFLKNIGYTLSIKQAILGYKKGGERIYKGTDQDMAICIDCMKRMDDFDKWVLMSGDGDFIDLCRELKSRKKAIEVWSLPGTSFNKRFCDYVDSIHFLGNDFFIGNNTNFNSDSIEPTQEEEDIYEKSRSNLQTISEASKKASL